jgi:outer membrane protein OmpA-like peptidoglycan-associated protein
LTKEVLIMKARPSIYIRLFVAAATLSGASGCASMNKTEKGAVVGAGAGAVVGGVIGNQTGSTTRGALIGAVIGGAAGGIIGHQMDQQARELQQNIPGAHVERVGEGIHVTFESGLLFGFDSSAIRGDARHNLDELARSLNRYPDSDLMVVGHTDAMGSSDYNQDLSERRAQSAASYLYSRGVDRRIETLGRGESEPVASNDEEYGREKNRRVEIAIYASEALRAKAQREAGGQ